ncbi:hypothetical protein COV20_00760 [Candidatus Woesearchaeota archaeon CG10_big_fil_rev_8_21_14_0_10_45_16]|nr:MAG: hypothetical protein COV20_00760 [Candidatus Woesearchaeota archaeon CG10_big_fil_rev_8_21_14_0_10_45_16]
MKIRVETDLQKCRDLWDRFSPKKRLWDLWEVLYCFNEQGNTLHFLVLEDERGDQPHGILPLWWDQPLEKYLFFGGEYMEDIQFWFDLKHFPLVVQHLPKDTFLYDINHLEMEKILALHPQFKDDFQHLDDHFFINLDKYSYDLQSFLATFGKKHRKNLLYDLRHVEQEGFEVRWETKLLFYDDFISYNQKRFGEESDFVHPTFIDGMRDFLKLLESRDLLQTSLVLKDGRPLAIEYAAFFNGVYYVLNGGYDFSVENLGKYLMMLHIRRAAAQKAPLIDFLCGDAGWKRLWNCESAPYYTFSTTNLSIKSPKQ